MIQALLRVNLGFIYAFNLTMRFHTRSLPCHLKKYHAPIRCILWECGILKECKNTIPNHTEKYNHTKSFDQNYDTSMYTLELT
jgi:hypothetical protein